MRLFLCSKVVLFEHRIGNCAKLKFVYYIRARPCGYMRRLSTLGRWLFTIQLKACTLPAPESLHVENVTVDVVDVVDGGDDSDDPILCHVFQMFRNRQLFVGLSHQHHV